MKLKLSLKVHFYSCIRFYIAYVILFGLAIGAKFIFNLDGKILIPYLCLSGIILSVLLGVYEYMIVLHTYLNMHPNPLTFWKNSILMNIANSIIILAMVCASYAIFGINLDILVILALLALYIFAFSLGTICYVLLRNVKFLVFASIMLLVCLLVFAGKYVQDGLVSFINYYLAYAWALAIAICLSIVFEVLSLIRLKRFVK